MGGTHSDAAHPVPGAVVPQPGAGVGVGVGAGGKPGKVPGQCAVPGAGGWRAGRVEHRKRGGPRHSRQGSQPGPTRGITGEMPRPTFRALLPHLGVERDLGDTIYGRQSSDRWGAGRGGGGSTQDGQSALKGLRQSRQSGAKPGAP